jgi:hypothetical protein
MSRLDDLPADQRATLSLLLRQGKGYAQVAELLRIDEQAVHDRAHAALAVLAPRYARELTAQSREQIGDYMLGQRSAADRLRARGVLEDSPAARAWAKALAAELAPLAAGRLPEIPVGDHAGDRNGATGPTLQTGAAAAHVPDGGLPGDGESRPGTRLPSSRVGGAIVLALIVAAAVVAVVLITTSGASSHHHAGTAAGTTSTATASSHPVETKRIPMTTGNRSSKTVGLMWIVQENNKYGYLFAAEHLPPSHGFFYALWLYNSPSNAQALNRVPTVGSSGQVQGAQVLPTNAANYHHVILTRETSGNPARPGPVVLKGEFALR